MKNGKISQQERLPGRDSLGAETWVTWGDEQCEDLRAEHCRNGEQQGWRLCGRNMLGVCKKQQADQCSCRSMGEGKNRDAAREDNEHPINHWLLLSKRAEPDLRFKNLTLAAVWKIDYRREGMKRSEGVWVLQGKRTNRRSEWMSEFICLFVWNWVTLLWKLRSPMICNHKLEIPSPSPKLREDQRFRLKTGWEQILSYSGFSSIQVSSELYEAHSQWGGRSAVFSLLTRMLISPRNNLSHTQKLV